MKIPSNKVRDIVQYFRHELSALYEKEEIEKFIEFCFFDFVRMTKSDLLLKGESTVTESDLLRFHFAVKDLKRGKPVQYILGKAWFYGMEFSVTPDVLIPRPETEELVQLVVEEAKAHPETFSIADIGTGSGCIAASLKKKIPRAHVYAVDVSEPALAVARENAQKLETEIAFLHLDILRAEEQGKIPSVMFIVSNPPYVKNSERSSMQKNVTDYEPHTALFVPDEDALVFYRALAALGKAKLKPGGKIFVEINEALGPETCILFQKSGYPDVQLKQDLRGKDRFVVAG
ncbi:MAG TPA: peptide chain release factor N(5)-glutamine methyltransferase [Bacteroidia bacterium]|nr:peptide chain release factor N(5)-glutamine methyltransferase [Bacteroidia bacterium]